MPSGGNSIHRTDQLGIAGPPQHHATLTVLGGLGGVEAGQDTRRPGNRTEVLFDQRECGLLVELSADLQDGIVRLVVPPVEVTQPLDGDVFDVGTRADD